MFRYFHHLALLLILISAVGCETLNGASNGFDKDIHNASDTSKNGWDAIEKADAWIQKNLW